MMYEEWHEGKLVLRWNETTKMVEKMGVDGVTVTESTPMTPEQVIVADAVLAEQAAETADAARLAAVKLIVTDLKLEKDRVQPIIDKLNADLKLADIKDVARAAKRIADAAIDLARLLTE